MSEKKKSAANVEVTAKTEKTEIKKKADGSSNAFGFCVYIGPTILSVIQSGTIYKGSRERVLDSLKEITEKYPLIKPLIVSDKTLAFDRVKVKTPGNILYENYRKLLKG
ncbi:MAG: hypothetical protein IKL10_04725 [Clostridia bacterium]|nr:hypothetical protein [Clostridia bacterium]